jgi:hypothetical protein
METRINGGIFSTIHGVNVTKDEYEYQDKFPRLRKCYQVYRYRYYGVGKMRDDNKGNYVIHGLVRHKFEDGLDKLILIILKDVDKQQNG